MNEKIFYMMAKRWVSTIVTYGLYPNRWHRIKNDEEMMDWYFDKDILIYKTCHGGFNHTFIYKKNLEPILDARNVAAVWKGWL
jgi:hypothetical protein